MVESKELLDTMFGEYSLIKTELQTYINLFHKHTNYITIYLSVIAALLSVIVTSYSKIPEVVSILMTNNYLPWPLDNYYVYLFQGILFVISLLY